ncbi:MAG TPA: cyclic peptide export ABC transporter, partial [Blastocatellia bacterium]|nr:cyclic peptide export ABC transporter [Blastocatellia bacterium]
RAGLLLALLTSLFAGFGNALLVALISRRLLGEARLSLSGVVAFSVVFLAVVSFDLGTKRILSRMTAKTSSRLRVDLAAQMLAAPLARLEQIGAARLLAILTEDVYRLSQLVNSLPALGMAVATGAACVAYLGWLSPVMLTALAVLAIPAIGGYWLIQREARRLTHDAQQARDVLFQHFKAVTDGAKELKLHARRRQAFFAKLLQPAAEAVNRLRNAAHDRHQLAHTWSQSLYFIFILAVFLLADWQRLPLDVLTGYALIILYLKSSLMMAISALPLWSDAGVALQRIESLSFSLTPKQTAAPMSIPAVAAPVRIELRGLTYQYADQYSGGFTLGPLDLRLQSGELVFIAGGNGSGKTTLLKLLTGLYDPAAGEIYWNGVSVTNQLREAYRQNFSVVFAEPFVFGQLLGFEQTTLDERAKSYLEQLQLLGKVGVRNGRLSTTALSTGQRKRLALLTAYLENRPVYVFDEWAASQDPEFREIFYRQLLPELKARGKLVIAITHDDQYFSVADRLIKLDFGKIRFVTNEQSTWRADTHGVATS